MRRVNPKYGSNSGDLSHSSKSVSVSQSQQKSKRHIEIEKLSDDQPEEDSYLQDEFEQITEMSASKSKTIGKSGEFAEKPTSFGDREKSQTQVKNIVKNTGSGRKSRPSSKQPKDATPIKEEAFEDEFSDGEDQFKRQ